MTALPARAMADGVTRGLKVRQGKPLTLAVAEKIPTSIKRSRYEKFILTGSKAKKIL